MKTFEHLFAFIQHLTPQHLLSRFAGVFANCECRWFKNFYIQTFIRIYDVDMKIAERENPRDYLHFNDFFTRHLKQNARPMDPNPQSVVAPADGFIAEYGDIQHETLLQAKGQKYSLSALLAGDETLTREFINGTYMTIYLSPKDYHRVHMPITGRLVKMHYVPGKLFSVCPSSLRSIPRLFARNERVICEFSTALGPMVVILIGAMIVASMQTVWQGVITPNHLGKCHTWTYSNENIVLERGSELGHFCLGSTAVVLFPQQTMIWNDSLQINDPVQMGTGIGTLLR